MARDGSSNRKRNMGCGKYSNVLAEKWLTKQGLLLLECWSRDGFSLEQIANKIGISTSALSSWRKRYPEIQEALSKGMEVVDYEVENALLKSALGYTTTETKTIIYGNDKQGNKKVRVEKTIKEYAPNVTAIAMWLNNRKPKQWKRNRDNVLELNDEDKNITINIFKHGENEEGNLNEHDSELKRENELEKSNPSKKAKKEMPNEIEEAEEYAEEYDDGSWPDDEEWDEE